MPNFWRTGAPRILKIQWFPLSILIFGQKCCFLGPTIFKIPQPSWHYYVLHIMLTIVRHSRFGHCKMSLKISGTYLPSLNNYEIFSILKKADPKYEFYTLIRQDVSPCEMKKAYLNFKCINQGQIKVTRVLVLFSCRWNNYWFVKQN